jgi:hypothetical protein
MENVGSRSLDANLQNPTSADLENVGSRSLDANLQNPFSVGWVEATKPNISRFGKCWVSLTRRQPTKPIFGRLG